VKIAILTLGTRGDVRPYVALGAGLKQAGNEVTLVTAKGFDELVAGRGLRYVALDLDLLELARSPEGKAALRSARGAWRLLRQLLSAWRQMLVDEWEAARSAEAIVYHPKALGGFHIAEALGVPGFLVLPVPALSPKPCLPDAGPAAA
jgi:sterol 3beta-glucosyltransferase